MANEVATQRAVLEAQDLLFLPEWLGTRIKAISGQNRDLPLPRSLSLSSQQKTAVQGRIDAIRTALIQKPDEPLTMNFLGDFLLAYSPPGLTEAQAMAKGRAYWIALNDLPSWALAGAIARWHRREIIAKVNYAWPTPPDLRTAALEVQMCAEGRALALERMLRLEQTPSQSDETRLTMIGRLKQLLEKLSQSGSIPKQRDVQGEEYARRREEILAQSRRKRETAKPESAEQG